MRRLSIRWRMTLWNTSASAVVVLGFGLLVYILLRGVHYDQIDRRLAAQLRESMGAEPPIEPAIERFGAWVRSFDARRDMAAAVFDDTGSLVVSTASLTPFAGQLARAIRDGVEPQFDTLRLDGLARMRCMTARTSYGGQTYAVMLLADLAHVEEEMLMVVRAILFTVPAALVLAATLGYLLARKALAPIDQLRMLTDQITAERLDQRVPIANSTDELGMLAATINEMIGRLERSFSEVRRFTGDASHELRTPIAVIRSEAEMGVETSATLDEARERLSSILDECTRLTWITDQLLTICREDAGLQRSASDVVALRPLVADAVEMFRPLAAAKSQSLSLLEAADLAVRGDAARLRHVLYNLLDNAIKYTHDQGRIDVALRKDGEWAVITVQDDGHGISQEHLPSIFDRFFRAHKGTSNRDTGAGLGLSIVKSVVETHGGRIEAESTQGAGSAFRVYLPLA